MTPRPRRTTGSHRRPTIPCHPASSTIRLSRSAPRPWLTGTLGWARAPVPCLTDQDEHGDPAPAGSQLPSAPMCRVASAPSAAAAAKAAMTQPKLSTPRAGALLCPPRHAKTPVRGSAAPARWPRLERSSHRSDPDACRSHARDGRRTPAFVAVRPSRRRLPGTCLAR